MKHTALPWIITNPPRESCSATIYHDSQCVARIFGRTDEEALCNAELIVLSTNAHEAMMDLLDRIIAEVDEDDMSPVLWTDLNVAATRIIDAEAEL